MKGTGIKGHISSIKERDFGGVSLKVYIDTVVEGAKEASVLPRKERDAYFKSPEFKKAKAEIEKKVASLHIGEVMLTQE